MNKRTPMPSQNLNVRWIHESIFDGVDCHFEMRTWQLTSSSFNSSNIYCEERMTSVDGKTIAIMRSLSPVPGSVKQLWVCDLRTRKIALISDRVTSGITSNIFSDDLYYIEKVSPAQNVLMKFDMATLTTQMVFDFEDHPITGGCSISNDGRYYVSGPIHIKGSIFGLSCLDLEKGTSEIFHEQADICNPHLQFEPKNSDYLLVQQNRGCEFDSNGNVIRLVGDLGATVYALDFKSGKRISLPVGKPNTSPLTGHECWISNSTDILITTTDVFTGHNKPLGGNIYKVSLSKEEVCPLARGLAFNHLSSSTDGRFFVADDFRSGHVFVGNINTGKHYAVCDPQTKIGRPQYAHPHPYMTADNKYIIYNSVKSGLAQVYAAEIPDGLLETLED